MSPRGLGLLWHPTRMLSRSSCTSSSANSPFMIFLFLVARATGLLGFQKYGALKPMSQISVLQRAGLSVWTREILAVVLRGPSHTGNATPSPPQGGKGQGEK